MPGNNSDLKAAIRAARNRAGIKSDQDLATRSGVHLQTIQNWGSGKTTRRPSELSKVAALLDTPLADLMAIYEGRDPSPPPLQDAIHELAGELRLQTRAISELAAQVKALMETQPDQAQRIGREVALAVLEATKAGALAGELRPS